MIKTLRKLFRPKSGTASETIVSLADHYDNNTADILNSSFALLEKINNDSLDLTTAAIVTHLFYIRETRLVSMSKLLTRRGFELVEMSEGRLIVSEEVALSEGWIWERMPEMQQVAGEFEGAYDGWDVGPLRKADPSD